MIYRLELSPPVIRQLAGFPEHARDEEAYAGFAADVSRTC